MHQEVNNAIEILKNGGIILYPSDTFWGIGCDAYNFQAVQKINHLTHREDPGSHICLVADDRMLGKYVKEIPKTALDILHIANTPTTIIYDEAKNLASNLVAKDNSIAIRIPDDEFCYRLCRRFNGAIVYTPANVNGESSPKSFKDINPVILKGVDYVVNLHREKISSSTSSLIKLSNNGLVKVIRA